MARGEVMDVVAAVFAVISAIAIVIGLISYFISSYGTFTYRTASGETGTAIYCHSKEIILAVRSFCTTDSGQTIQVEHYEKEK